MYIICSCERGSKKDESKVTFDVIKDENLSAYLERAGAFAEVNDTISISEGTSVYEAGDSRIYIVRKYNGGEKNVKNFCICPPVPWIDLPIRGTRF